MNGHKHTLRQKLEILAVLLHNDARFSEQWPVVVRDALRQIERGDALASAMVEYVRAQDLVEGALKMRLADIDKEYPPAG